MKQSHSRYLDHLRLKSKLWLVTSLNISTQKSSYVIYASVHILCPEQGKALAGEKVFETARADCKPPQHDSGVGGNGQV